jgi:hypothetical protein
MLKDKKRAYNTMISRNTRQNEQECKEKGKEAQIFRQKKESIV